MHFDDGAVQASRDRRDKAVESAYLSKGYLLSASVIQILIAICCFAGAYPAKAPFSWIFLGIGGLLLFVVLLFGVGSWGLWHAHRDAQCAFSSVGAEEQRFRRFLNQFKPPQDTVYLDLKAAAEVVARANDFREGLYQEGLRALPVDPDSKKSPQELFKEKANQYENAFQKAESIFYAKRDAARDLGYVVPATWGTYVEEETPVLVEGANEQPGQ